MTNLKLKLKEERNRLQEAESKNSTGSSKEMITVIHNYPKLTSVSTSDPLWDKAFQEIRTNRTPQDNEKYYYLKITNREENSSTPVEYVVYNDGGQGNDRKQGHLFRKKVVDTNVSDSTISYVVDSTAASLFTDKDIQSVTNALKRNKLSSISNSKVSYSKIPATDAQKNLSTSLKTAIVNLYWIAFVRGQHISEDDLSSSTYIKEIQFLNKCRKVMTLVLNQMDSLVEADGYWDILKRAYTKYLDLDFNDTILNTIVNLIADEDLSFSDIDRADGFKGLIIFNKNLYNEGQKTSEEIVKRYRKRLSIARNNIKPYEGSRLRCNLILKPEDDILTKVLNSNDDTEEIEIPALSINDITTLPVRSLKEIDSLITKLTTKPSVADSSNETQEDDVPDDYFLSVGAGEPKPLKMQESKGTYRLGRELKLKLKKDQELKLTFNDKEDNVFKLILDSNSTNDDFKNLFVVNGNKVIAKDNCHFKITSLGIKDNVVVKFSYSMLEDTESDEEVQVEQQSEDEQPMNTWKGTKAFNETNYSNKLEKYKADPKRAGRTNLIRYLKSLKKADVENLLVYRKNDGIEDIINKVLSK